MIIALMFIVICVEVAVAGGVIFFAYGMLTKQTRRIRMARLDANEAEQRVAAMKSRVEDAERATQEAEAEMVVAQGRKQENALQGGVVGTLMSNYGLELALQGLGIEFVRAKVGDRYVMEQLQERNWLLGGESSGHIVCLDKTTTGDGIVSALQVLAVMVAQGKSLEALRGGMVKLPQTMINVRLPEKREVVSIPQVQDAVKTAETQLAGRGRVLLRPSGTEPLIRVMVEGEDAAQVTRLTQRLARVVKDALAG